MHKDFFGEYPNNRNLVLMHSYKNPRDYGLRTLDVSNDDFIKNHDMCYSECARIYYLWKHPDVITTEYIGICHYRRYFDFLFKKDADTILNNIFKINDIIIPKKDHFNGLNNYEEFCIDHNKTVIDTCDYILKENYPDYYDSWLKFKNSKEAYYKNMFIMRKNDFMKYCNFLFDIVDKISDVINAHNDSDTPIFVKNEVLRGNYPSIKDENDISKIKYQSRLHGFLFERLSSLYFEHNFHGRIHEEKIINTETMIEKSKIKIQKSKYIIGFLCFIFLIFISVLIVMKTKKK